MTLKSIELARYIDHTILKPTATESDVARLCEEAVEFGFCTVCVNSALVGAASRFLEGEKTLPISVVGFPLGATLSRSKGGETADAVEQGAREIDMVLNLGAFKAGMDDLVVSDVEAVVKAAQGMPVKVILETALLDADEIVRACNLCVDGGAQFVKTSTGFGPGGATVEAVRLMRKTVGDALGVKASGGISSYEDAISMIDAGANRIGASASVAIVSKK